MQLGLVGSSLPGLSLALEVQRDHDNPNDRRRCRRPAVLRRRAVRARRVPRRLPGTDPRRVRPGPRSPAVHVRRPRLDYESHATGLDRNEVGALLVAAGLASASEHALVSLLAINGLRVSEALGADIDALGLERGHRTLTVLRKGGKVVTIPLAPRTARAIDLAIGERVDGRSSWAVMAGGSTATLPGASCDALLARPVSTKRSGRTPSGMRSSPPPLMPASRSATCRKRPVTLTPAPQCATTVLGCRSTGTPPTSWRPSSPAPPAKRGQLTFKKRRSASRTISDGVVSSWAAR